MPYTHFTSIERNALQSMLARGLDKPTISVILGKDLSSIYREMSRNATDGFYISLDARKYARWRRRDNKPRPKRDNKTLMKVVDEGIEKDWSPEQIAGRMKIDYAVEPAMRISHETIYQYLYERMETEPELKKHMRHGRLHRSHRTGRKGTVGPVSGRVSIDDRPAIVDEKVRGGDWEGDTVWGKGNTGAIATFVDRSNKFLCAKKIRVKTASAFSRAAEKIFGPLPRALKQSLTLDNGSENALHKSLSRKLELPVYFAHPYHAWERGLNEHTNGLLRQYFPKGMSFRKVTQKQLDEAVEKINNRPRKSLGYLTPYEAHEAWLFAFQT